MTESSSGQSQPSTTQLSSMDEQWMHRALLLAQHAQQQGEVPVGAILVKDQNVIGEGWNQPILSHDPTAHAEIIALRQAASHLKNYRLVDTTLYVTLEPCIMCVGAILQARVQRLVFGASDTRVGAAGSVFEFMQDARFNHSVSVQGGVLTQECSNLLTEFFRQRRNKDKS